MCVCVCVCVCVRERDCMFVTGRVSASIEITLVEKCTNVCASMSVCIYVCVYVRTYVCALSLTFPPAT